ncbi:hypothetical protein [Lichenibacterium dinghuense]|uniref:hypothetical protein n=1 Tax=Lichenibacterium dinghuense TaxID=2895977 RepID=UPI001F393DDB|nr:hypothetical protein [Lichenibacterium sp. 6Y81]
MPDDQPVYPLPPEVLGLRWHSTRMQTTRYGFRRMSHAHATDDFRDLWGSSDGYQGLKRMGFTLERDAARVVHWGGETTYDPADVDALAARVEADRARERAEARRVRDLLQHEVDTHAWALSRESVTWARALLSDGLGRFGARKEALELVAKFEAAVAKAGRAVERAMAATAPEDVARCHHPEVRGAVHEACVLLSTMDEDHAAVRNSMGWSKATSHRGHWLAELPELSPDLAAVGLGLVRRHLGQLRPDLGRVLAALPAPPAAQRRLEL